MPFLFFQQMRKIYPKTIKRTKNDIVSCIIYLLTLVGGSTVKRIIEFKNVSFRYDKDGPWAIKDVSFTVFENESIAIIGHNGSGKSTIAKLMNGLLTPEAGEIWINNVQLSEETV